MVYLPTFTIKNNQMYPNVGKYTIHGWYGIDVNQTFQKHLKMRRIPSWEPSHMPQPAGSFGDDFPFPLGYGFVPLEPLPTTYQSSHTVHLWCRTAGRRRRSWRWRCNCRCWCCRRWHHALLRWSKATPTLQQRMLHLILLKCQGLCETRSRNFGRHYFIQSDFPQ